MTVYLVYDADGRFFSGDHKTIAEAIARVQECAGRVIAREDGCWRELNREESAEEARCRMSLPPIKPAYIEVVGGIGIWLRELASWNLREIGEFTRENVLRWMESHTGPEWVGVLPVEDFHAVCGDIDIPWSTEKGRQVWSEVRQLSH